MLVIYKTPKDPVAFDPHYFDVHVPLAKELPGLRKYEVSKSPVVALVEASDPYLVANLHFDSLVATKEAFATARGCACAAGRRLLAPDDKDIQILLFDDKEV